MTTPPADARLEALEAQQFAEKWLSDPSTVDGYSDEQEAHDCIAQCNSALLGLLALVTQLQQENADLCDKNFSLYTKLEAAEAALARAQETIQRFDNLIHWALGDSYIDEFPSLPDDWPKRKFYWRGELRKRFEAITVSQEPTPAAVPTAEQE